MRSTHNDAKFLRVVLLQHWESPTRRRVRLNREFLPNYDVIENPLRLSFLLLRELERRACRQARRWPFSRKVSQG